MIHFVTGNLFDNPSNAEALAHGCNCQGAMGAGIAVAFREQYPKMFEEYRRMCKTRPVPEFKLGDVFFWREEGKPAVFNLATQWHYHRSNASLTAVRQAMKKMREIADENGIKRIAMPRIGSGLGKLSWSSILPIVREIFDDWPGDLYIHSLDILNDG